MAVGRKKKEEAIKSRVSKIKNVLTVRAVARIAGETLLLETGFHA
ncbi:hypothetical protein QUB63_29585 [Microcoleus sp. ARI1-B5]